MLVNIHTHIEGSAMRENAVIQFPTTIPFPTIFLNFRERGQPLELGILRFSEISYAKFLFHVTFLSKFPVKWFAFPKFRNFRSPCQEIPVPFGLVFRIFWLSGKHP